MTPQEALSFWYSRVDFERKPAAPADLKLDRIRELLRRLDNPHDRLRIVHIAGSKGKGSTAAMFSAVAQGASLRTGLFTSPHLVHVNERIQIDGSPISEHDLTRLLNEIRPAVDAMESAGQSPTFFEIGTAIAFRHFAQQNVQLAVIEVGLGGRFDSTNVCTPLLSVITSISYEHTDILGDKLHQIAFEKAGIIKPGVPVVSGVTTPEAEKVIRELAAERQSPLQAVGVDFRAAYRPGRVSTSGSITPSQVTVASRAEDAKTYDVSLLGSHQATNASLVVASVPILRAAGLPIDEAALRSGLANVCWPARMEAIPGSPLIVLDCAHNVASAEALVATLKESFPDGPRALVFAASSDKDVRGMMQVLVTEFERFVFTRYRQNPRSLPAEELAAILHEIQPNANAQVAPSPDAALEIARTGQPAIIVVAGSVFLAGELRPTLLADRLKACQDSETNRVAPADDPAGRSESSGRH